MAAWGAVIVNYNSARFALDAALSVLGDDPDAAVVIVDNASTNNSRRIFEDAVGAGAHRPFAPELGGAAPRPRPADLRDVSAAILEEGAPPPPGTSLSIVLAQDNAGFSAGCNKGLRFLRRHRDCARYLLLNPDAVVAAGALDAFAAALAAPDAGLCGGTVLLANDPGRVQAFAGARLRPLSLMGENIGQGELLIGAPETAAVEARLDYPLGAAVALKADYLDQAGYLDERYFLYYEEADWALAGWPSTRTVWARDAVVFHHYGVSSGSQFAGARRPAERSPLAEYHMARSRLLFALKWRPWLAPLVFAVGAGQILTRLRRGRRDAALALARGALPGAPRLFRA